MELLRPKAEWVSADSFIASRSPRPPREVGRLPKTNELHFQSMIFHFNNSRMMNGLCELFRALVFCRIDDKVNFLLNELEIYFLKAKRSLILVRYCQTLSIQGRWQLTTTLAYVHVASRVSANFNGDDEEVSYHISTLNTSRIKDIKRLQYLSNQHFSSNISLYKYLVERSQQLKISAGSLRLNHQLK